jgi:hypothetical protein
MQPTFDENDAPGNERETGAAIDNMPRRLVVRRSVYDLPPPSDPDYAPPEDEIEPRRLRWWHVAGALFLVGILLLDVLAPVIQGVLEMIRFVPAGVGQPL